MPLVTVGFQSMTIPSGASTSNALTDLGDALGMTIYAPVTITATQVRIQVEPSSDGTNFVTLQSGGTDVLLTAATATVISPIPFKQMRLISTSVESQNDVFKVTEVVQV